MTTNALMELADRLELLCTVAMVMGDPTADQERELLREAATQFRTAAAEGGEAVAWQFYDGGKWHNCNSESHRANTAADGRWPMRPLYLHPPTDSGAGRDGLADELLIAATEYIAAKKARNESNHIVEDADGFICAEWRALRIEITQRYLTASRRLDTAIAGAAGD